MDYCSNFLIGGYNSDGSTRLYSLVEEDELLASIRGRIMKKIALINPPFRGVIHRIKDAYPLGLGYIKAYCESKGVVCDLYDFSCSLLSDQALEEKYCLSDYDVIGVSSYSLFFSDTVVLIELLKKDRNIIVVGGHHATLCGSKILRDFPVIDFCLKGFGEKSFYDFISNIDTENVYSVSGLCYRKGDEFIDNPVNYEGIDINEFPVPDRGDIIVDASNYEFDATKRVFHISTSRGCPYHCTYCVNCILSYRFPGKTSPVADCGTKIYMDVSEVYEEKMKLIKTYKSQIYRTEENSKTEINRGLHRLTRAHSPLSCAMDK